MKKYKVRNALMVLLSVTITILLVYGTGLAAVDDSYTKSLLHFDGDDASTVFTDDAGASVSVYGDSQIDTDQNVFGGASGLFDGLGDYLLLPHDPNHNFGTGDFTIEFFMRRNGSQIDDTGLVSTYTNSTPSEGWTVTIQNSGSIRISFLGSQRILTSGTVPDLTWTHIAVVRYGNTVKVYINGAADSNSYDCTGLSLNSAEDGLLIARLNTDALGYTFNGWIDELRITKGIARYTSDFSTPNAPFVPTSTPTNTPTDTSTPTYTPTSTPTNTPTDTSTPTYTPTWTPGGPTPTLNATQFFEKYKTVAIDNSPLVTIFSLLCGILILAGIVIGAIWITKRKQ